VLYVVPCCVVLRVCLPAAELWGLLQQPDAVVYVCGDAKAMAKDVHRALCKVRN
jgi:sulfite reductase alpha subunit-like flavoprotein